MKLTYETAGVSPSRADGLLDTFSAFLKTRPRDKNLLSGIGPYASAYSLKDCLKGMSDPLLVTCCDGVGTKVKLAVEWNCLDHLGEDLVAMNVNDLICLGATPLLFLDYYASAQLDPNQMLVLLKNIQFACEKSGCVLAGGETAEMPGLYQGKDFDLAGFSVGMTDRSRMLGPERVRVGDRLLGVESSGFHSNGYSLVRKIVEREKLRAEDKTPFSDKSWAQVLLAPTLLYPLPFKGILKDLSALAHITGSGLFGNLPRVLAPKQKASVLAKNWPKVPLYQWVQEKTSLSQKEILETFNGGVGIIAIVPPNQWNPIRSHLESFSLKTFDLGTVDSTDTEEPYVEWKE